MHNGRNLQFVVMQLHQERLWFICRSFMYQQMLHVYVNESITTIVHSNMAGVRKSVHTFKRYWWVIIYLR